MSGKKLRINQLKAGVVLSYSSMILGYVIAIAYTPIMLRLLGQSEYGLYNYVSSIVSYLGLLSFGFGSAYMRYYSRYKVNNDENNIAKLNGMFLIVFCIIGIIASIAGMVLVFNADYILGDKLTGNELGKAKILMAIMVLNLALSFPASVFNSHITANEQFIFQKSLQMIKVVANPFVVLPVLLMGYKSVGMVVMTTILNLSIEFANMAFCFKKLKIRFSFRQFDFSLMKEITVFSSYIFLNMIIDQVNWNIDKFILGRFWGTVSVAVYGLAAQLNTYYLSLSTAISNVFIPRVNRMVASTNNDEELTDLFTKVGRIQFMVLSLICTGLIFFGQPFISMWAGVEYRGSYPIALLLIIPVTIPLIQNLGIEIQKAKNMHQFRSIVYLIIAIGNICISIPLAKAYGGVGAAIGTAVALLIGNGFIMNWYYHKRVGINIIYFWSQILRIFPSLFPPVVVGVIIAVRADLYSVITFLLYGSLYAAVFCLSSWFLGMNQYERDLVGRPILRLLKFDRR